MDLPSMIFGFIFGVLIGIGLGLHYAPLGDPHRLPEDP